MTTDFSPGDGSGHYDEHFDTYRVQYDRDDSRQLTTAIAEEVAAVSGTDPEDLEPLYETVDPDALDRLLTPRDGTDSVGGVWFHYAGYRVTVRGAGEIEITPASDPALETDD